jgi:superfamily II DNA helicase RecQ
MNDCSVVLVIAPLSSIIDDQITALKSSGYPFKVLFSSAENVLTTKFQDHLLDHQSDLSELH